MLVLTVFIAAVAISSVAAFAHSVGKTRAIAVAYVAVSTITVTVLLWDRARRVGTPFRYEEPAWFTVASALVPIALAMIAVRAVARRARPAGLQVVIGTGVGLIAYLATVLGLYVLLVNVY